MYRRVNEQFEKGILLAMSSKRKCRMRQEIPWSGQRLLWALFCVLQFYIYILIVRYTNLTKHFSKIYFILRFQSLKCEVIDLLNIFINKPKQ